MRNQLTLMLKNLWQVENNLLPMHQIREKTHFLIQGRIQESFQQMILHFSKREI